MLKDGGGNETASMWGGAMSQFDVRILRGETKNALHFFHDEGNAVLTALPPANGTISWRAQISAHAIFCKAALSCGGGCLHQMF